MNSRCIENEMPMDYSQMNQMPGATACPTACPNMCPPVYECPISRVCERVIVHEVPQV